MKIPAIVAAAVLVAGCGSSAKTAATGTASMPTATMMGSGMPPMAGSTTTGGNRTATTAAGKHDHAGESCSGRDQAKYAGEGLTCVTGRLKPKN